MSFRPRDTPKDGNHWIPRDFLRDRCGGFECVKRGKTRAYVANYQGFQLVLFDTSDMGGVFSDWLIFCTETAKFRWIEMKIPEAFNKQGELKAGELKDGEAWLQNMFPEFRIVSTDEEFEQVIEWMTH